MSTFLSPHYTKLFQVRKWRGIWIFTTTVGFNVNTPKFVRSLIQLRFFLEHILGKFLFFALKSYATEVCKFFSRKVIGLSASCFQEKENFLIKGIHCIKKCPYSELFWSAFNPNAGKHVTSSETDLGLLQHPR